MLALLAANVFKKDFSARTEKDGWKREGCRSNQFKVFSWLVLIIIDLHQFFPRLWILNMFQSFEWLTLLTRYCFHCCSLTYDCNPVGRQVSIFFDTFNLP